MKSKQIFSFLKAIAANNNRQYPNACTHADTNAMD